ncbi:hypothetical protein GCM10017691_12710 [Pseudonocardia petroleophila]|uniref:Uncharacterized protein n=1 Tax=Pseudonocardia petroleophila TaxID=37331 RepID=A0A7G7MIK0_9PSEU|nr:hypothetical protein [Pseudonocardia petroleophila]QNG52611.1 hypothetical protein H6H00_00515 [Pseudonocardia petroleophila]
MSRPTAREIADLTARLRQLSTPGRHADPDELAAFLDDKHALLDRIAAAERGSAAGEDVGHRAAVDRFVALGSDRARAEAMVSEFTNDRHDVHAPAQGDRAGCLVEHEPESTRREQLALWHTDDQAAADSTDAQEETSDADGR